MELIRKQEEQLAQQAYTAASIAQSFRDALGERRIYPFHKFERSMFQVSKDPKELFEQLFEMLQSMSDEEPVRGKNTYKLKQNFKKAQIIENKKPDA